MTTDFIQHWIRDDVYTEVVFQVNDRPRTNEAVKFPFSIKASFIHYGGSSVETDFHGFVCFLKITIALWERQL